MNSHLVFIEFPFPISQVECNAILGNSSDEKNTTNTDLKNVDGDDDGDGDDKAKTQNCDEYNKIKNLSNRIAKRSYRRRSDSQSSTTSAPMDEPMPQPTNENSVNSSRNNREVNENEQYFILLLLLFRIKICLIVT